jgi:protein involved in polysaccharide export with SLBB domain
VEVLGQVKRPGFYDYQPGRMTEEYIEAAGGFAKLADKSKTRVSRGRFGDIGYARDVEVPAPGDVIWVPEKVPVGFWALAKDILSVTSQAAALVLVIREIRP